MRVSEVIDRAAEARKLGGLSDMAGVVVVVGTALSDDWDERRILEIRPDHETNAIDLVTEPLQANIGYTLGRFSKELEELGPELRGYEVRTLGDPVLSGEDEWYTFNTGLIAVVPDMASDRLGLLQWFNGWEEVLGHEG